MKPFAYPPEVLEQRRRANILSGTFKISGPQEISYLHDAVLVEVVDSLSAKVCLNVLKVTRVRMYKYVECMV
jgi:hypothetical protein